MDRTGKVLLEGMLSHLCCCISLFVAVTLPAFSNAAGLVTTVLDNGLRVTILPAPASPVVATQIWYHVGSADEKPQERGLAHLFEHLMFGATTNSAHDEYERHHHVYGGRQNALTAFDETVFYSEIAPEGHSRVLELEADRMANLVVDRQLLKNEKRIVEEELRWRTENDPVSRLMISGLGKALEGHPYAHPPVGTHRDINRATVERCREFYRRAYGPSNAHVVVVGPVDGEATLTSIRRLFGPIERRGAPLATIAPLSTTHFPSRVIELSEDLPPAEIAIVAYPLPPAGGPDHWAVEVLRHLLSGGAVDPFEDHLVRRLDKAIYAETQWLSARRGGVILFTAAFVPYRRQATGLKLMHNTVLELNKLQWLTPETVASARRALVRRELERSYRANEQATALGRAAWWLGDSRLALSAADELEAMSIEEVATAYRRYVTDATPIRAYVTPEHVPLWIRLFGWMYPLLS